MRKLKRILASFLVAVMSLTIMQIETFYIVSEAKYSSNDFYSASYSSDPGEYMVNIARAQKNRTGSSLGYNDQWCAYFISDCAEIAGQSDAIPPRAGVNGLTTAILNAGGGQIVSISEAKAGDVALIDFPNTGYTWDHVELVVSSNGSTVNTIGGNSGSGSSYLTRKVVEHSPLTGYNNIKIYRPNYKSTKINLNFNANGGTGSMSSTTVNYGDKVTLPANSFSKTGYTFNGWNVKRNNDNKWYATSAGWCTEETIKANGYTKANYKNSKTLTFDKSWTNGISGPVDVTFYAQWVPNTLKVYFNANGASITSDTYKISSNVVFNKSDSTKYYQKWTYNKTKEHGLVNCSSFGLYKTGYHFAGWGTSASGGTIFDEHDASIVPTALNSNIKKGDCTVTLYAQWVPNTLNVYYNANGASITSDDYKISSNLIYKKSDSTKFYQIWTYNKTKENGLVNCASFGLYKTGYHFAGWGTSASGGTIYDENDSTLTPLKLSSSIKDNNQNITLYAQWVPNTLNVYYNANGASITSDNYKISSNLIYKKSDSTKYYQKWTYNNTKENGLVNCSSFGLYKTGYHFTGWGTSASGGTIYDENDSTLTPLKLSSSIKDNNQNITLYAQWVPNTLSVYYSTNGGTVSSETYKVSSDYIYTKSDSVKLCQKWTYNNTQANGLANAATFGLQRHGYTFAGWSTSASGGTVFDQNDTSLVPTDFTSAIKNKDCSLTMYAQWTPNKVTMHFQSAGELLCRTHTLNDKGKLVTNYAIERTNATQLKYNSSIYSITGSKTATLTYGVDSNRISIKDAGLSLAEHEGCGYIAYRDYDGKWRAYINDTVGWYSTEEISEAISSGTFDGYHVYAQSGALKTTSPKGNIYFYAVWVDNHTHNYVLSNSYEGTCTESSYSTYTCSCGDSYQLVTEATGHVWDISSNPATCESSGTSTKTCSKCGTQETIEILPLGHDYTGTVLKESSCTVEGEIEYKCSRCDNKYTEITPQLSHSYIETVINPTCTSNGYTITKCSVCGEETISDYVEPKPHDMHSQTISPTCTTEGYTVWKCSECNEEYESDYVDPLGHQGESVSTIEPTCTSCGYSIYHCNLCGENYNSDYTEPADHSFDNDKCTICGYAISDIYLDKNKTVTLSEYETAYFKFVPETSGAYYFCSFGSKDTYGYLYDCNMVLLDSNDDSGYNANFKLTYEFEAGQTYYLAAKFYSSVPIGDITVSISESFSNFTKAPDSTTIIDIENKLIYNLAPGLASYDILNRYISVSGDYYVEFSCASLGTGSILSLYNYQTSDLVDEYTILIFGDVNGDGWYDGTDAMIVNCLLNGLLTREQVGEAVWAAADCNHDGVIDAFDVALLEKAGLLLSQIDQSKSESELLESDAYIEYQSLIDQSPVLTDSEPEVTPDPEPETEPTIFEQIVSFIKQAVEFILSFVKMLYK